MPFVRFRDCTCPETPHSGPSPEWGDLDGDVVELRPFLDLSGGAEALRATRSAIAAAGNDVEKATEFMAEYVGPVYVRRGVLRWNVVDENGPVACTPEAIAALPWVEAYEIADRADDLYGGSVLAPLVKRIVDSSAIGSTAKPRRQTRSESRTRRSA